MHSSQHQILENLSREAPKGLSYEQLGKAVDISVRQKLWYHVKQLRDLGLVRVDLDTKIVYRNSQAESDIIVALPIYGAANCGEATAFADDYVTGYLRISKKLLDKSVLGLEKQLVAVQAIGDSMNSAEIGNGKLPIQENDYVLIDVKDKNLTNEPKYIASIINGMANIKKARLGEGRIELLSESTSNHPPIFIHENDNYLIAGKVVQVIPKELDPKNSA